MNDSKQRKAGAILSYFSIIVSTLVQLIYTPFLIRMLGQSEYGLYSLVSSIIGYLTVLDLGFGNAIIVYTTSFHEQKKYDEEKKLHGMFKLIFIIIGGIAALLGIILYLNVGNFLGNTMTDVELSKLKVMMLILVFNLAVTFPFSIYSSIISAYEKFTFQKIISILNTLLKPILMIPLLFLGYKSISLCVVITLVNMLVLFSNYFYCKKRLNINIKFMGFDKNLFKIIFGYSIWIFLGIIVDKINWNVDQFILGAVSGTIAISIYSVASTLNTFFLNLSTALSGVFLPKISKMVANEASADELTNEMIKVGRLQYFLLFLACSSLVLFGKEFIIWWVGDDFTESYYVAMILIIPLCFPLIQNIGISIMQAMNRYKFKSISTFIMAIFNVIISVILASKYGAIGSAIGTAIALIICNIFVINIYYYKNMKLNVFQFWKEILQISIPLFIPILFIIFFMFLVPLHGIVSVIIYGFIYVLFYCIICYMFSMNDYEKKLVYTILSKFVRKKERL